MELQRERKNYTLYGKEIAHANKPPPIPEELGKFEKAVIQDYLENHLQVDPPNVYLPFKWTNGDGVGGPRVSDPLTVQIEMPMGDQEVGFNWSFSFSDLVKYYIADVRGHWSGVESDKKILRDISEALTGLAGAIEAQLSQIPDEQDEKQ